MLKSDPPISNERAIYCKEIGGSYHMLTRGTASERTDRWEIEKEKNKEIFL